MFLIKPLRQRLQHSHHLLVSVYTAFVAFSVYSCMYAFRKPFTVGVFDDMTFAGHNYKIWLVIAQTLGYAASKFYGVKFIGEMSAPRRAGAIMVMIVLAWLAMLGFAATPAPYNIIFLFLNGFPLGLIFGLVLSFVEGRRMTEFIGSVVAISFIFSSGFAKSVGKMVMLWWNVSEFWMPFVAGAVFIIPMFIFIVLLNQVPPPTAQDELLRTRRAPMDRTERRTFLMRFLPGLILLIICYVMLTTLRDMRDNFAADMWRQLGYERSAGVFTQTEIPISIAILMMMSLLVFVKDNYKALLLNHAIIIAGFALAGGSTLLFQAHLISPFLWMTLCGLGLYMGYIPFNCLLFERLIATFRYVSNVGFILYIADSYGYLGSITVMLIKDMSSLHVSWLHFYMSILQWMCALGIVLMFIAALYFRKKYKLSSNGGGL